MENNYDFRKKLLTVHEPGIRNMEIKPGSGMLELRCGLKIIIPEESGIVLKTAAYDFIDFLAVSMNISGVSVSNDASDRKGNIIIESPKNGNKDLLREANSYKGFYINISDYINIVPFDERGAAQALYYLEDIMSFSRAPYIECGEIRRAPMFSPQMVHSGYGLDEYPDEYLARIAHDGRDAILVFVKGINQTPSGFLDFNNLISRAFKYGIDVYAYSLIISEKSPYEPDAKEYYRSIYGELFRMCPGLCGVVFVGESVEFPSMDTHVAPGRCNKTDIDGIPTGKYTAGWYPCCDYPDWICLIKDVISEYKPNADIVFWTYNWGFQSEEARVKLIDNLPRDISLEATFEMFEERNYGKYHAHCADYTLSFEGAGKYFKSEAAAAKKNGIKLYSMTNTAGLTWDFGTIPYEPMPYQWIKRYKAMIEAKDKWGLCGIMESHHYGFYPSFISKLSKWAFWEPREPLEEIAETVIKGYFGADNYEKINKALALWSDAIRFYTPTDADQYGAFRVGPAYPFNLDTVISLPSDPDAMWGSRIVSHFYSDVADVRDSALSMRINDEIKSLEKMYDLMKEGLCILETISDKDSKTASLYNLGQYITNTVETGIRCKKWHILKCRLHSESDKDVLLGILNSMEQLVHDEEENVKNTIAVTQNDSRLGWEPSMLYIGNEPFLNRKLRQLKFVLENDIEKYRKCIEN